MAAHPRHLVVPRGLGQIRHVLMLKSKRFDMIEKQQTPWVLRPEIKIVNPVADRTLEGAEAAGLFPRRVLLSPKKPAWRRTEVLDWLNDPSAWAARHRNAGIA